MTATHLDYAHEPALERETPGFGSALRAELMLTRKRASLWVVCIGWALSTIVMAYLVTYMSVVNGSGVSATDAEKALQSLLPSAVDYNLLGTVGAILAPLLVVLGGIVGASDYGRGTLRLVTSRFGGRMSFLSARMLTVPLMALIVTLVNQIVGIACSLVVAGVEGRAVEFPALGSLAESILIVWLAATAYIMLGVAVGVMTRSLIASVVIGLGWFFGIEQLLVGSVSSSVGFVHDLAGYLPGGAMNSLAASRVPEGVELGVGQELFTTGATPVIALVAWLLVSTALTVVLFQRRDID
jgi:ABC-2 type transport system permease protein